MRNYSYTGKTKEAKIRHRALLVGKRTLFLFFIGQLLCSTCLAQYNISGTVTDASGKAIAGVSINLRGKSNGTTTDERGAYSLNLPGEKGFLIFTHIGYKDQEVSTAGKREINVVMEDDSRSLSGVVVIGYGKQTKDLITTAVSKMDTMVLKNFPYSNPAEALKGTLPGVRVTTTSGQPGAAPVIVVRGGTELNPDASIPLYVIDGVISPDMTGINAADIESVQVLKDAAATAIYGARGSNGVIIVTTKSGHAGRNQITYNYGLTFSHYDPTLKMLGAKDFIYYNRLAIAAAAVKLSAFEPVLTNASSAGTGNDLTKNTFYTTQYETPDNAGKLNQGWQSMPDPLDNSKTIIFKNTDWRKLYFRTAVSNNHNITASGGTDKATYSLSAGYLENSGVAIMTGYRRLSLNFKGDLKLSKNLRVFSQVLYSDGQTKGVSSETNIFGRLLQVAPTEKYAFEDGTIAQGPSSSKGNPVYLANVIQGSSSQNKSTITVGAEWDILPGLSFNPQVSRLTLANDSRQFIKSNYSGRNLDVSRSAQENYSKYIENQADAVFAYKKSFNRHHNVDVTAGFSYVGTEQDALGASGQGAATDLIPTLNASAVPLAVNSSQTYFVYAGYFARANYNYDQKYILSISTRYDGASNLGQDYKWGLFPGVSVGWNIHKENFWQPLSHIVSQFKLRGSYGVNGNVNGIGAYQAQGAYTAGSIYGGVSGIQNTILANPQLQWEQSKTYDGGLDLGFLGNRLTYTMDLYSRETSNQIASRSLPQETGFGSILTNLGTLRNRGVEFGLDFQVLPRSTAFQWNVSFNAAYVTNKILKLPYNGILNNRIGGVYIWDAKKNAYAWEGGLQEGGTIGNLYGYKQLGLYQSDGDAAKGPYDIIVDGADKTKFGGDVNWLDADKNDTIDTRDRVYMGNSFAKWTGGISNTFSFKNFYLFVRMDFMTGQTIYDYVRATTTGQFAGDLGLSSYAAQSWQKPGDKTDIPRLYYGDYQENLLRGNSIMYEKGNYLAVREVTLSYEVPSRLLNRYHMGSLRFNATAHNLHYFTKYKGLNPETDSGTDNGYYPISSDYVFGATITF